MKIYLNPDYKMDDIRAMDMTDICRLPIHIVCVLSRISGLPLAHEVAPTTHPWVVWASKSKANYEMLWNYGMDILDVHDEQYGKKGRYKHGSLKAMEKLGPIPSRLSDEPESEPPL